MFLLAALLAAWDVIFATLHHCQCALQTRFKARSWSKFLLDYLFTYNKRLVAAKTTGDFPPPWTEYTLYWIYAAHADVWDDYHCKVCCPFTGLQLTGCILPLGIAAVPILMLLMLNKAPSIKHQPQCSLDSSLHRMG